MAARELACRGCLLGLAVGDAMGHAVDEKTWDEIREDYGPNGLLGYDLVNDCAEGSSYTQVAAYVANGLLLGITGAVIAFGLQWLLYSGMVRGVESSDTMQLLRLVPFTDIWMPVAVIFLVVGIMVGVGGSLTAIRKFLNV